jgi:hypothetical protein
MKNDVAGEQSKLDLIALNCTTTIKIEALTSDYLMFLMQST